MPKEKEKTTTTDCVEKEEKVRKKQRFAIRFDGTVLIDSNEFEKKAAMLGVPMNKQMRRTKREGN